MEKRKTTDTCDLLYSCPVVDFTDLAPGTWRTGRWGGGGGKEDDRRRG